MQTINPAHCFDIGLQTQLLTRSTPIFVIIRHSSSASSAAAVKYHDDDGDDDVHGEEDRKPKKEHKKETSPEECDQAVAGLSSAKERAKKVMEMQKKGVSILKKMWSIVLRIGPFVRTVATMSRQAYPLS